LFVALGLLTLDASVNTSHANELIDNISIEPSARYRYQQISDDGRGDAIASTLKIRLSAMWDSQEHFSAFLQADHVHAFNEGRYNSVTRTIATSPIIDVPGSELNQAWVQYDSGNNWLLKLGRQHLGYNNERHLSSIEFWQNDQSFDALTFTYDDKINWSFTYTYLSKVHRIFSDDAGAILPESDPRFSTNPNRPFFELGNHDHDSHLANLSYQINRNVTLTGFALLLENETAQQFSSNTVGLRLEGQYKPDVFRYIFAAELAKQETASSSPWNYSGYYGFIELGAQYKSHRLSLSHERLTEQNGFAFATSLGNTHLFLGWADAFSSYSNADGIQDTFLTYRGRDSKLRWRALLHQYRSDSSDANIGQELDIELAYRYTRDWELTFLASFYKAKDGLEGLPATQEDLTSLMASLSYQF
jgi:hypothetical protein